MHTFIRISFLFWSLSTFVASQVCDVCIDTEAVPAISVVFGGGEMECSALYQIGQEGLSEEQCLEAQYLGITECGCPDKTLDNICYLCEDKTRVTSDGSEIFKGKTCSQVEHLFVQANYGCAAVQQTAGVYCGCDNPTPASCRICPNYAPLFDPTRLITTDLFLFPDDTVVTCAQIEYTANTPTASCSNFQKLYASQCCYEVSDIFTISGSTSVREESGSFKVTAHSVLLLSVVAAMIV
jgi:hypothetical protein